MEAGNDSSTGRFSEILTEFLLLLSTYCNPQSFPELGSRETLHYADRHRNESNSTQPSESQRMLLKVAEKPIFPESP